MGSIENENNVIALNSTPSSDQPLVKKPKLQSSLLNHFKKDGNKKLEQLIPSPSSSNHETIPRPLHCELEYRVIPKPWLEVLESEFGKPYFLKLKEFLMAEKQRGVKIFPPENQIYNWAVLCPFDQVSTAISNDKIYILVSIGQGCDIRSGSIS